MDKPTKPTTPPPSRQYVEGCEMCALIKATPGFGPRHDPSPRCESGKHPHCTCDTCF